MSRKWSRALVLAAAAGLAAQVPALAQDHLRITKPVQITRDDVNPSRTYNAPNLLADPSDGNRIVGAYADFRTGRCNLIRSTDAGQSWELLTDSSPMPEGYPFCQQNNSNIFHGYLAFGRGGTLYYAIPGWDTQDRLVGSGGNFSVILSRSDDLGDTWEHTIVRDARGKQAEEVENNRPVTALVVDTKNGSDDIVYVTWQRGLPGRTAPNAEPTRVYTSVSTDGGRTFGDRIDMTADAFKAPAVRDEALRIASTVTTVPGPNASTTTTTTPAAGSRAATPNQEANFGGRNPTSAIDDDGNVYVLWHSAQANLSPAPPPAYFLTKSTDRGKTWTTTQVGAYDRRNGFGARLAWSPEGGDQGTLHWVAMGNENPDIAAYNTIYYRQSTDGGATWTDRRRLPDVDPAELRGQYIPNIAVARNGRVDVAWWDTRDDPGTRSNDVYYTYSTDNGKSWSANTRITDRSISRLYGVWGVNYDMSSPPGIASTDRFAVFAWDDTRFTDPNQVDGTALGGGTSDMFAAAVQFEAVGGGTSATVKIVLAGVVGLLAVGLVLLLLALGARRRTGEPLTPRRTGPKAPAGVSG
ncbi:MAG: sialidase family protein [Acidimicrobiia bacterium]